MPTSHVQEEGRKKGLGKLESKFGRVPASLSLSLLNKYTVYETKIQMEKEEGILKKT